MPWFRPVAEALVAAADPRPGERAVDIGVGRGAALFPLAEAVGPDGSVTGFDLSAGMVAATEAEARDRGLAHVRLAVLDASDPSLPPDSFDVAVASLVLFFLPDPVSALRAWRELLVPGGRLAVSTFGQQDQRWERAEAAFRPYLPAHLLDARTSGSSGPFATDAGVEGLLLDAGYADVRTTGFTLDVRFRDAGHWFDWTWSHGMRGLWEWVPEAEREGLRDRMAADVGAEPDGSLTMTQEVRLTLGTRRRPGAPAG